MPERKDPELAYTPSGAIPAADAKRMKMHGVEVTPDQFPPHLRRALGLAQLADTADQTEAPPMDEDAVARAAALDADPDKDDDGETDVEHFPLPAGLLADAGLTDADSDDPDADFDAVAEVAPPAPVDNYGTRPGGGS